MSEKDRENAWQKLQHHATRWRGKHLREVLAADPQRNERFGVGLDGLYADFSRHWLDEELLTDLLDLARAAGLEDWRERLFRGEAVNTSERRAALHTALRAPQADTAGSGGARIHAQVIAVRERMYRFAESVRSGEWQGHTGKRITDVINIGIGGSHLGPEMAVAALADAREPAPGVHFIANADPHAAHRLLRDLDPETTLFIVASKTFTTAETLANARLARRWLVDALQDEKAVARHFAAVSANEKAVRAFGIAPENLFPMWDWVGGRYSLWSAIGLPVVLACGAPAFDALLAGAAAMDRHFYTAPLEDNMPVRMALLGAWYANCHAAQTEAVIPYRDALRFFPAYLQQLCMESLGKRVGRDGRQVSRATGSIVWGDVGTNAQHAFFQLLHQGTHLVPVDFILSVDGQTGESEQYDSLIANCLAQAQALACGRTEEEAAQALRSAGLEAAEVGSLLPHKVFPGNRPSTLILLERLDARRLGMLIALYEHKVFVQSVLWNINPFDQMGVELGKELATGLRQRLAADPANTGSIAGILALLRKSD